MYRAINSLSVFLALLAFVGCTTTVHDRVSGWERDADVPSLTRLAQDTSAAEYTRESAIKALRNVGNREAIQALIALLDDNTTEGGMMWQVEIPVGKTVRDPRFKGPVYLTGQEKKTIYVAGRPVEITNIQYVYSVWEAQQFEKQGAIVKQIDATRYPVRESACKALQSITGKDFGLDYAKWRQWWSQNQDHFLEKR